MFSKSILLAIALGVTAMASGTAPASASHSQPYPGYRVAPMTRPPSDRPAKLLTTVQRSEYPMPRRPYRQPFQ